MLAPNPCNCLSQSRHAKHEQKTTGDAFHNSLLLPLNSLSRFRQDLYLRPRLYDVDVSRGQTFLHVTRQTQPNHDGIGQSQVFQCKVHAVFFLICLLPLLQHDLWFFRSIYNVARSDWCTGLQQVLIAVYIDSRTLASSRRSRSAYGIRFDDDLLSFCRLDDHLGNGGSSDTLCRCWRRTVW